MASLRRLITLTPVLHALFVVTAVTQTAIVPLLPHLDSSLGVSPAASALLLAAPGLATLAISIPAGVLADRVGPRQLTIAAAVLLSGAALAQAIPAYPTLIAGRLVFGVAFGIVWTTGTAWLTEGHDQSRRPHIGAVATSAAVGMAAGPAVGGFVADQWGMGTPFLLVGTLTMLLTLMLCWQPPGRRSPRETRHSLAQLTRVAPRQPGVVGAAVVLAIGGAIVVVGALIASTGSRAIASTVAYPLATRSAGQADLGDAAVIGLLNGVWAMGLVLAPLVAGPLDQANGTGVAYLSVIVPGALVALWLLVRRGRGKHGSKMIPTTA